MDVGHPPPSFLKTLGGQPPPGEPIFALRALLRKGAPRKQSFVHGVEDKDAHDWETAAKNMVKLHLEVDEERKHSTIHGDAKTNANRSSSTHSVFSLSFFCSFFVPLFLLPDIISLLTVGWVAAIS